MRLKQRSNAPMRPSWHYLPLIVGLWIGEIAAHPELRAQIEMLSQKLEVYSGDPDTLIQRGDLHRRHGDYAEAARDFSSARTLDPEDHRIDLYEGRLALAQARPDSANALLNEFLRAHPNHAKGLMLRGDARAALARFSEAAADYRAAIAHTKTPTPALYLTLARLLARTGSEQSGVALTALDAGLEKFPNDMALLGMATDLALKTRQLDRATRYIDAVPDRIRALPQWRKRIALIQAP